MSKTDSVVRRRSGPVVPARLKKILVAEENAGVRQILRLTLSRAGFDARAVADGEAAWSELQTEHYDLLVTDHDLPQLSGLNLVVRMRRAGLKLPVIVASNALADETRRDYSRLEITAMIAKPIGLLEFLNGVRQALGTPSGPGPAAARNHSAPPTHNRVLIADDDAVVRGSLVAVLQSEGYDVEEACNGIEAVTCAIKHKPDLVLLDLNMPHADGWTAFNQLDRITPLVPVIVITARPNQYAEAVRVGVDAFMEKPLNIPILVRAVRSLADEEDDRHVSRITKRSFVTQLLGGTDSNSFQP